MEKLVHVALEHSDQQERMIGYESFIPKKFVHSATNVYFYFLDVCERRKSLCNSDNTANSHAIYVLCTIRVSMEGGGAGVVTPSRSPPPTNNFCI